MEHCTIFFPLFCSACLLCLLLPLLLICLGCSVCPCHLLSLALHSSSAVSGGALFYPPLPSARLTPHLPSSLGSHPTCSPKAVEFSTGGIVPLRDAMGEGRLEGSVVVLNWHLLLFPWVYSKIFVFWHNHLPCSPFPAWSTLWHRSLVHLCLLMKGLLLLTAKAPLPQGGFWQLQEWHSC